jgi:hypothetical protein
MPIDVLSNRRHGYRRIVLVCGAAAALTAASGAATVRITDIVVDVPTQPSSPKSFRNLAVGVQNDTDAGATFDISCEWKCPYGNLKNFNTSIEQGAYLDARKSREFARDANIGCDPMPVELTISCEVVKRGPKDAKGKTTWKVLNTGKKTVQIPKS